MQKELKLLYGTVRLRDDAASIAILLTVDGKTVKAELHKNIGEPQALVKWLASANTLFQADDGRLNCTQDGEKICFTIKLQSKRLDKVDIASLITWLQNAQA